MNYISCIVVCLHHTRRTRTFVSCHSMESGEPPTLSFLSLQFRQPNLDLRIILRSVTSFRQFEAIFDLFSDVVGSLTERDVP